MTDNSFINKYIKNKLSHLDLYADKHVQINLHENSNSHLQFSLKKNFAFGFK